MDSRALHSRILTISLFIFSILFQFSVHAGDDSPPYWLSSTSDGGAPITCNDSGVVSGFSCKGRYCDDVNLLCAASDYNHINKSWTSYFSEEAPNARVCEENSYVTGIRCSGNYCDKLSLQCGQIANDGVQKNCAWTGPLSEESSGEFVAPTATAIAGVRCSGSNCDNKEFLLCEAEAQLPSLNLEAMARRFAPSLRFDQLFGTGSGDQSKCFPSDPGLYFDSRRQGADPRSLCNQDYTSIADGGVPAYYVAKQIGADTVVIRYWYFYAWQSSCTLSFGSHAADWESMAVVIVNGELQRVAYFQHGGWYSREVGQFETADTHPVAYVGKNSHGSYHDAGGSGGCLYFEDYRNPGGNDYKMELWHNLVELKRGSDQAPWMNCEGSACFDGVGHPLEQTGELLSLGGCNKDGCGKSSLQNVPFITKPADSDLSSIRARHSGKCLDVAGASTSNFADVTQYDCHAGDNQKWKLESTGDGNFRIRAKHSSKCLDVAGGWLANGAAVHQYSCHDGDNQRFTLINGGDGYFSLQAKHSGKCLDIYGATQDNGGGLAQWSCHYGNNQLFRFVQ